MTKGELERVCEIAVFLSKKGVEPGQALEGAVVAVYGMEKRKATRERVHEVLKRLFTALLKAYQVEESLSVDGAMLKLAKYVTKNGALPTSTTRKERHGSYLCSLADRPGLPPP